jgi:hypothetical protein
MAQAVSRRPLTNWARVRSPLKTYGICVGQSGTGTVFSKFFCFLCQYHSTVAFLIHICTGWTTGLLVATVQRNSLTPSTWTLSSQDRFCSIQMLKCIYRRVISYRTIRESFFNRYQSYRLLLRQRDISITNETHINRYDHGTRWLISVWRKSKSRKSLYGHGPYSHKIQYNTESTPKPIQAQLIRKNIQKASKYLKRR